MVASRLARQNGASLSHAEALGGFAGAAAVILSDKPQQHVGKYLKAALRASIEVTVTCACCTVH